MMLEFSLFLNVHANFAIFGSVMVDSDGDVVVMEVWWWLWRLGMKIGGC
jgi:hypothetical protein